MRGAARERAVDPSPPEKGLLQFPDRAPGPQPVRWMRVAADTLTFARFVAGAALALWPWEPSVQSLALVFRWKLLLWTADAADGVLARRSRTPPSWIGRRDIWIDAFVTLAAGIALARAGFLPGLYLALWLSACVFLYLVRPVETVLLAFMFPVQIVLVAQAALRRLPEVALFALWVAALAYLDRRRLKWVIEQFIKGLPDGPKRWVWSWLPAWLRLKPEERAQFED